MRAGELNRRVIIETFTQSTDAYGDRIETWETHATRWAKVAPLRGREFYDAQQINSEISIKVTLRLDETIKAKMRVSYGSRVFEILAPLHNEDYQETALLCKEVVE